jgi:fructose/tagatose bisphosphate aldolase
MPLVAIGALMEEAARVGYALGYFESWDLASLEGVIDAAEQSRSPVIIGFNGEFLSRPGREARERLALYAAMGRAAAESASVPCGLIWNECPDDDWTREAIALGFNLVMPVPGRMGPENYVGRVKGLTHFAHGRGVAVEAEVGELPHGASGDGGPPTDPEAAAAFVEATGIDLLAVSVGNVHVLTSGQRGLDLDRLEAIRRRVPVPLVLHGGTGIAAPALRAAVARGVAKVNFGTYLKQRFLKAVRDALGREEADPHRLLGLGGPEDVLVAGRRAVRDAVMERIDLLGCRGRA